MLAPHTLETPRYRLAPGTTVLAADGGWIIHTPDQELLEIDCPESDRPTVAAFLADPGGAVSPSATDVVAPLIDYLTAESALEVRVDQDAAFECTVWCDPGLDRSVLDTVLAQQRVTETTSPSAPLLAVAGWLPDARWQDFDEAAVAGGQSWLPVYAEGDTWYAGPLRSGTEPITAGYRDLRVRRLAASPCPARLDELWRSAEPPTTQLRQLAPMVAALESAIAALRTDVLQVGNGNDAASLGDALNNHQLAFGADGTRRTHPVLPVPLHLLRNQTQRSETS